MIKRIRRLPGDRFEIISDNPIVPPQVVNFDDLHVVGRVVWVGRRV
jgi:phage repressor protein C with HTH and peptisase S24 domain